MENRCPFMIIIVCFALSFSSLSCAKVKSVWLSATAGSALDKGQYDKAIAKYEKLTELNPDDYSNYWNLGVAYARQKQYTKAQKQIAKLESLGKDDLAEELKKAISDQKHQSK